MPVATRSCSCIESTVLQRSSLVKLVVSASRRRALADKRPAHSAGGFQALAIVYSVHAQIKTAQRYVTLAERCLVMLTGQVGTSLAMSVRTTCAYTERCQSMGS